jgi:hypothetical protein
MKSSSCVADFDSATAMLRALVNYLKEQDFPLLGAMARRNLPLMKLVANVVNELPSSLREQVYIWGGRFEAISPRKLRNIKTDEIAEWMSDLYPKRNYPGVAIGSSNGAAVHLWSALGIPWLPQTFLIPVARSGIHPDEPMADAQWGQELGCSFLEENPDVQLHHMNDPIQDRLMIQRMAYFRIKRRRLGPAYKRFILDRLQPGATIFLMDCRLRWPTTQFAERYFFQFGALGGATAEEYHHGSERVNNYLARYRSHLRSWTPPQPDADTPEAEWGFEATLAEDVLEFAERHEFRVRRIIFEEPEHFSPFVAGLYEWWNQKRHINDHRLLVESFIVMEPYWTVRSGSIPFWMVFNKEPSAQALEGFLCRQQQPFEEIYLMLFSHGVNSIGLVPIERWIRSLKSAQQHGSLIGVDSRAYPQDFGVFVRYNPDLKQKISARYPMPAPLTLMELEEFVAQSADRYQIRWE